MIDMDEDIAKVFRESTSVSLAKGNSAHLMKISSKRRRTKREIEEEKQEEMLQKVEFAQKMQEFEQLKAKMAQVEEKLQIAEHIENQFSLL